jgi:hypothetical protein
MIYQTITKNHPKIGRWAKSYRFHATKTEIEEDALDSHKALKRLWHGHKHRPHNRG